MVTMGNATSIFDCAVNPLHPMPDDGEDIEGADSTFVLDNGVPLRESSLWKLQRNFYEQKGIKAWSEGIVPHFVSSNAFVARQYARILVNFLRDIHTSAVSSGSDQSLQQPVYIFEVGSGHGKLSYQIIEALLRFRAILPPIPLVYVITDPVASVLDSIAAQPALSDWISSGLVDFAVLDAEERTAATTGFTVQLRRSGTTLTPGSLVHPSAVLCTYVLDSLCCDAVRIGGDGSVMQLCSHISMPRNRAIHTEEALQYDMLKRATIQWSYQRVRLGDAGDASLPDLFSASPYSSNPLLCALVTAYRETEECRQKRALVLLPLGGMNMLQGLMKLTGGRMLLLVGDKGHSRLDEFDSPASLHSKPQDQAGPIKPQAKDALAQYDGDVPSHPFKAGDPHVGHHGSFSLMVNLHALRAVCRAYGGHVLSTAHAEGFKVSTVLFSGGRTEPDASLAGMQGNVSAHAPLPRPVGLPASPSAQTDLLVSQLMSNYGAELAEVTHTPPTVPVQPQQPMVDPFIAPAGSPLPLYSLPPALTPAASTCASVHKYRQGGTDANCKDEAGGTEGGQGCCASGRAGFTLEQDEMELMNTLYSDPTLQRSWPCTLLALQHTLAPGSGPSPQDFSVLQRAVKEEVPIMPGPSLRLSLSLLRFSCHDSEVFMKVRGAVIDKAAVGSMWAPPAQAGPAAAPGAAPDMTTLAMAHDIRGDVERTYSAHYALQPSKDVFFDLARVLMGLRDYTAAIGLFTSSESTAGPHHVTVFNKGLCWQAMGEWASALECFNTALQLYPEYAEAAQWREKVQARLAGRLAAAAGQAQSHSPGMVLEAPEGVAAAQEEDVQVSLAQGAGRQDETVQRQETIQEDDEVSPAETRPLRV